MYKKFKKKIKNTLKNEISKEILLSGLGKSISLIISYIYIPIVMSYLGVEKYGIWTTILSILSWISYFDIGIGNGLRNRLTESLSKKDNQSRKLVSSAYAFISVIMIIVALSFSAVATFVDWNKIFGITDIKENLAYVVIMSIGLVAVNFILSICKNVLYALQKAANVSVMELLIQILNLSCVLIVKLVMDSNLFIIALIYGMSMIIVNLITSLVIYIKNREVRPNFKNIDLQVGKDLTNLGVQFFLIQICAMVLFTTDSLMISCLYGAVNVTPYDTVNKLFNAVISVYSALLVPVWSAVTRAKAEKKYNEIIKLIHKLKIMMIPFVIGTSILVFVFKPLSKLWLGQDLDYSKWLIVLGGIYCLLSNWCNTYANIANGLELMKVLMITAIIQAVVNIPLSLFFAEVVGMQSAGVMVGTILSMIIAAVVQPIAVSCAMKELRGCEINE